VNTRGSQDEPEEPDTVDASTATEGPDGRTRPRASVVWPLVFLAPLAWAVLVLFHPMGDESGPFESVRPVVNRWLVVHFGQLFLTPFLVLAVWRLLDGVSSSAGTVSRCAVVVWAIFFSAYDAVQGIATGLLIRYADGLAASEQVGITRGLNYLVRDSRMAGDLSLIGLIAGAAWLTTAIAAAIALHKAGASKPVVVAACFATIVAAHTAPAAVGFVALAVAGMLRERERASR
jgi:hypothetical protein